MLFSLSKKCQKCGEQCLDPDLLLVARGSAWGSSSFSDSAMLKREHVVLVMQCLNLSWSQCVGVGTAQREILRLPRIRLVALMLLDGIGEEATAGGVVGAMITTRELPGEGLSTMRIVAAR
jgi:hypothetical protein